MVSQQLAKDIPVKRTAPLKVLIGCETSGTVRRAFAALGHDAWSVDVLPSEDRSNRHIVGDVRDHLNEGWDLLAVMHPPCVRLCLSGLRWLHEPPTKIEASHYTAAERKAYATMSRDDRLAFMWAKLDAGTELFSACWNAPIERIAVENPIMHRHARERIVNFQTVAQVAQPWWFGAPEFKGIGLYLKGLAPLVPTDKLTPPLPGTVEHKAWSKVHMMSPGADRWQQRSKFFPGIAAAMAAQWGGDARDEREMAA